MANNKMMYSDGGYKMKNGGSCGCMPKYTNNPRALQGQMLQDGGLVNAYMSGGSMKGDKVSKGSMYRRGGSIKTMKQGGYK